MTVSTHARTATLAYSVIAIAIALLAIGGAHRWDVVIALFAVATTMAVWAWRIGRRPQRSLASLCIYVAGGGVLLALMTRV